MAPIADFDITGNRVGIDFLDEPAGNAGDGIRVESLGEGLISGRIAYNEVHSSGDVGIQVIAVPDLEVTFNVVGDPWPGLGNQGDGIRLEAATGTLVEGNTVVANGGDGLRIDSSPLGSTTAVEVVENELGVPGAGNGGSGVHVVQSPDANHLGVLGIDVIANEARDNGAFGLFVDGRARNVRLSRNLLQGNGRCGIQMEDGVDREPLVHAPTVFTVIGGVIEGRIDKSEQGLLEAVEVFADPGQGSGGEASVYLGDALVSGTEWTLAADGFVQDDIRATLIRSSGATSELTETCGDGCGGHGNALCDDHEECTWEVCDSTSGVCLRGDRPVGWRCSDEDVGTGIVNPTRFEPDTCNGEGVCSPGPNILLEDASECAWASPCNYATLGPAGKCSYAQKCEDGSGDVAGSVCSPADLDAAPEGGPGCVNPCDECGDLSMTDQDGDSLPDPWENAGIDADCDGGLDYALEQPPGVQDPHLSSDIWLEVDYMSLDCLDSGAHNHRLPPDKLQLVIDRFLDEGIRLHVDQDSVQLPAPPGHLPGCIPETTVITSSVSYAPRDPDCQSEDVFNDPPQPADPTAAWQLLDDLKKRYFTPERRGVYRYAVIGHGAIVEPDHFAYALDGVCQGLRLSQAEDRDDELFVAKSGDSTQTGSPPSGEEVTSLMHELGHNLGRDHGGFEGTNQKPNYQSNMNYRYQWDLLLDDGSGKGGTFARDYSREVLPTLDEGALVEGDGLPSQHGLYLATWACPPDQNGDHDQGVAPTDGNPIDWNCNTRIDPGTLLDEQNLNNDETEGGDPKITELVGAEDWTNLYFPFQCAPEGHFQDDLPPDPPLEPDQVPALPTLWVAMDVVPGCAASPVPLDGDGDVEVVLLADDTWSVGDLALASLRFQTAHARAATYVDVDGNGHLDVRAAFPADEIRAAAGGTVASLSGALVTDQPIHGSAAITVVSSLVDADQDGVSDPCDLCPATPIGSVVDDQGCPS